MNSMSVKDCIEAGYSTIVIQTSEENRTIETLLNISKEYEMETFLWSCTRGIEKLHKDNGELSSGKNSKNNGGVILEKYVDRGGYYSKVFDDDIIDIRDALGKATELYDKRGKLMFILPDTYHYFSSPDFLRMVKELSMYSGLFLVFLGNNIKVPDDWEEIAVSVNFELPNKSEFKETLIEMIEYYQKSLKGNITEDLIDKGAEMALGLTMNQAENAFATSFAKKQTIDLSIISEAKAQFICKDGLLEFFNTENVSVGGMYELKEYTSKRVLAFSDEAKEYGLPSPKGVLLVGIPGCGKSLAAKSIAQEWKVPLIKCDLGKLFGSYVGDTEANTRKALKTAETMSPCVLWIDEIEKGLSGIGGNDSGVSTRMFGNILTWMQEKENPVYVVATANSISNLPQELLRKGRFDEIFFVDLPNENERRDIIKIQLKNKKRDPEKFNVEDLVKVSEGFTGAEIEEAIVTAMFNAYADNARELNDSYIASVMDSMNPASKGIMKNSVEKLQNWAKERGVKNATSSCNVSEEDKSNISKATVGRKIFIMEEGEK